MVFIINCNSSWPFCPCADAVTKPTGLFENTVVATHHSIAFFNPLGILKIYSGVQMMIPSAFKISSLKSNIFCGVLSMDNSGLK